MRIAIISTYPPKKCGIGIYTKNLVESITKKGHSVEVISFKGYGYGDKYVQPLLDKNRFSSYLKAVRYIKENKFDRVLIQHEHPFYNIFYFPLFVFLLRIAGKKVNINMHTIPPYNNIFRKIIYVLLNTSVMIFASQIIVHTSLAKEKLESNTLLKKKVSVIPIPIAQCNAMPKLSEIDRVNLLCFGFVHYDKGFDVACEAFAGIKRVHLNIVGTIHSDFVKRQTPYFNRIKAYSKKYPNIKVIDRFISEDEKKRLFRESDFVLLPYRFIEQSAVLTDSWAYNKIPICSDIPALKNETEDGKYGVLFESENPVDFKKSVLELMIDKAKQQDILDNIAMLNKERSFDAVALRFVRVLA